MRLGMKRVALLVIVGVVLFLFSGSALAQSGVTMQTGKLAAGATYLIEVPSNWNGIIAALHFCSQGRTLHFHPAETIAAVQTLLARLETGKWPDVDASNLNAAATALGPGSNIFVNAQGAIVPVPSAFVDFKPLRNCPLMAKQKSVKPDFHVAIGSHTLG
jgi:hypothetical protein